MNIGDVYGRSTVISLPEKRLESGEEHYFVQVVCSCPDKTVRFVKLTSLQHGKSTSCGCVRLENMKKYTISRGRSQHPLYQVWSGMRSRCYDETDINYDSYGGRGIKICDEWKENFDVFFEWAIDKWQQGLKIERKNNNGDYCPSNCKFADNIEQSNNKTTNRLITAFGETKTMMQWTRDPRCVVGYHTLKHRIYAGWDSEKAIITPSRNTRFLHIGKNT